MRGQGPGRVPLSDSSGTEGEKPDSYQVFPDYSQLVPDRTANSGNFLSPISLPHKAFADKLRYVN